MPEANPSDEPREDAPHDDENPRLRCDFCGEEVARVRRVALDDDYDRLQKPHPIQYACESCSEEKERARRAQAAG